MEIQFDNQTLRVTQYTGKRDLQEQGGNLKVCKGGFACGLDGSPTSRHEKVMQEAFTNKPTFASNKAARPLRAPAVIGASARRLPPDVPSTSRWGAWSSTGGRAMNTAVQWKSARQQLRDVSREAALHVSRVAEGGTTIPTGALAGALAGALGHPVWRWVGARPRWREAGLGICGLLACGPSVGETGATGSDTGTTSAAAGTPMAGESGGDCVYEALAAAPLGPVTIVVRNLTTEVAYLVGAVAEWGDAVQTYRLFGPDGEEISRRATRCVASCGAHGVVCPSQCMGGMAQSVAIEPGASFETEWSGRIQMPLDIPPACAVTPNCGETCVAEVAASAGSYQFAIHIETACTDASGDPCDCVTCPPDTWRAPPTHTATLQYRGAATVTLDFEG